jgi:hypothetical protein
LRLDVVTLNSFALLVRTSSRPPRSGRCSTNAASAETTSTRSQARTQRGCYWIIRDGDRRIATGVLARDAGGISQPGSEGAADRALTAYKAEQYEPVASNHPSKVVIADALLYYGRKALPETKRPKELAHIIERLNDWWGRKRVSDIKESTCRAYVAHRGPEAEVAARNELPTFGPPSGAGTENIR